MRFTKAEQLLRLVYAMQSSAEGISLRDIETLFGVSHRTAQRMRDAVSRVWPQIEERTQDGSEKRWRIRQGAVSGTVAYNFDELSAVDAAARQMESANQALQAGLLHNVSLKLKARMQRHALLRLEPDLEALLQAEGIAARADPRPRIDSAAILVLREAIMRNCIVTFRYLREGGQKSERKTVRPLSFLYGYRHYLVGGSLRDGKRHYLFSLSKFQSPEVTGASFVQDPPFDIATFARGSFGTWMGPQLAVRWRFSPAAASAAREFIFHADQVIEEMADGSLVVCFTATSELEMILHLYIGISGAVKSM